MYCCFLSLYSSRTLTRGTCEQRETIEEETKGLLSSLLHQFTTIESEGDLASFQIISTELLHSELMLLKYNEFKSFMESLSKQNCTICLWYQFISLNCFAYIGLFLAIRYRNWELRIGSIKLLAAVISAFVHSTY